MNWRDELQFMYRNDPIVYTVLRSYGLDSDSAFTLGSEVYQDLVRKLFKEKTRLAQEFDEYVRKMPLRRSECSVFKGPEE